MVPLGPIISIIMSNSGQEPLLLPDTTASAGLSQGAPKGRTVTVLTLFLGMSLAFVVGVVVSRSGGPATLAPPTPGSSASAVAANAENTDLAATTPVSAEEEQQGPGAANSLGRQATTGPWQVSLQADDKHGPLGLNGSLGPLGFLLRDIYDIFYHFAVWFRITGTLLFCLFPALEGLAQLKDWSGFVERIKGYGLPAPAVFAAYSVVSGPGAALLLMSGVPVLREWGCELMWGLIVGATYYVHYKPYQAAVDPVAKRNHYEHMMKNVCLVGALTMIIGYEIPRIGRSNSLGNGDVSLSHPWGFDLS